MNVIHRNEGQVTVLTAIFIVALLGMTGFVLDVGSWFRQQRVSQATVDAAALAGVQALPEDATSALSLATTYANDNGGSAGATITFSSTYSPNDTITVTKNSPATGFFSKLFGVSTVNLPARASAVSEVPVEARYVAPIVVNLANPDLSGPGCPCFNSPTTLPLGKTGAPGAFAMVNLDNSGTTGTTGASTLAAWLLNGYDQNLPLGDYFSDSGAKFNNNQIQAALQARYATDLLFPVYDSLTGQGSNAVYHIVGWASFHLTLSQASGTSGSLTGYFTQVVWSGVVPTTPPNPAIPDLGVHSVALID